MFEPPSALGQVFERHMTTTPVDFERNLLAVFPEAEMRGASAYRIAGEGAVLDIALFPAAVRRIASLALPTCSVRLCFMEGDAGQRKALLARLDRAMQKGGG